MQSSSGLTGPKNPPVYLLHRVSTPRQLERSIWLISNSRCVKCTLQQKHQQREKHLKNHWWDWKMSIFSIFRCQKIQFQESFEYVQFTFGVFFSLSKNTFPGANPRPPPPPQKKKQTNHNIEPDNGWRSGKLCPFSNVPC